MSGGPGSDGGICRSPCQKDDQDEHSGKGFDALCYNSGLADELEHTIRQLQMQGR